MFDGLKFHTLVKKTAQFFLMTSPENLKSLKSPYFQGAIGSYHFLPTRSFRETMGNPMVFGGSSGCCSSVAVLPPLPLPPLRATPRARPRLDPGPHLGSTKRPEKTGDPFGKHVVLTYFNITWFLCMNKIEEMNSMAYRHRHNVMCSPNPTNMLKQWMPYASTAAQKLGARFRFVLTGLSESTWRKIPAMFDWRVPWNWGSEVYTIWLWLT